MTTTQRIRQRKAVPMILFCALYFSMLTILIIGVIFESRRGL
jgi:hypothetical protein